MTSYIHKKNSITKEYWQTFSIIKDSLLINNNLPINFWAKVIDNANYLQN